MKVQGDAYAKGWDKGREDALREAKATLIRSLPMTSVVIAGDQFIHVEETLNILDSLRYGDQTNVSAHQSNRR